jgi:CheY-like chemotaxis protein
VPPKTLVTHLCRATIVFRDTHPFKITVQQATIGKYGSIASEKTQGLLVARGCDAPDCQLMDLMMHLMDLMDLMHG